MADNIDLMFGTLIKWFVDPLLKPAEQAQEIETYFVFVKQNRLTYTQQQLRIRNLMRIDTSIAAAQIKYVEFLKDDEVEDYKYCCPVCLRYFNHILKSSCCQHYICRNCVNDMARRSKLSPKYVIRCIYCFTNDFVLSDEEPNNTPREYTDTPAETRKRKQVCSMQEERKSKLSPLRLREDNALDLTDENISLQEYIDTPAKRRRLQVCSMQEDRVSVRFLQPNFLVNSTESLIIPDDESVGSTPITQLKEQVSTCSPLPEKKFQTEIKYSILPVLRLKRPTYVKANKKVLAAKVGLKVPIDQIPRKPVTQGEAKSQQRETSYTIWNMKSVQNTNYDGWNSKSQHRETKTSGWTGYQQRPQLRAIQEQKEKMLKQSPLFAIYGGFYKRKTAQRKISLGPISTWQLQN